MNPTQVNSRECLQRAIDAEVKLLEESIRALKSRRNTLSPISSLPPEVFAAIFSFACLPGIPSLGGTPDNNLTRLHISHVCRQWREIALNQPVLWSHIDFDTLSSASVTEMLVRAQSAPLYLEASMISRRPWDSVQFSTFQTELKAHVPHMRHLSITARDYLLRSTVKGLVSPAPTLECLSLSSICQWPQDEVSIQDTLFDGSTPRHSRLQLRNCDISWTSPLLNGLKYLEVQTPSQKARPELAVWLDALNEMPQLKALTLHSASPIVPPFPFDVNHTVTLPSLTHLDISDSERDCALALAHLDLPALTWLCLTVKIYSQDVGGVQGVLPYIVRHAYGPQDIQPLQSVLIRNTRDLLSILAWSMPDIDVELHNPPTFLGATLPTRVALSFKRVAWPHVDINLEILDMVLAGLPLDSLVMFAAQGVQGRFARDLSTQQFWLSHSPKWPLLRRVRLASPVHRGFIDMLLDDTKSPLLPSLTDLVLNQDEMDADLTHSWVPLEILDLRMYNPYFGDHAEDVRLLSEIVVDVLGPIYTKETRNTEVDKLTTMWDLLARGPFLEEDNSDEEDYED
ncbi:hypothetical protein EI94DRAFT_1756648 [Lactarius quietus]|nr:hypothetical protein EI94DRAFT_1756648 [Lactarius quietus]